MAEGNIAGFLRTLQPEGVREIRIPKCPDKLNGTFTSTWSGCFDTDHLDEAAKAVEHAGKLRPPGIYVTLNPINPDLLARAANRIKSKARETTSDADVICRRWLLLDIDARRPAGISATDDEVGAAYAVADTIHADRAAAGWPSPLFVFSGNGCYLLYRVDLPNDTQSTALLRAVTEAIGRRHDTAAATVDRATFNAARILKVAGTWARKGDSTVDRPHRQSNWTMPSGSLGVVSVAQLEALAETTLAPTPPPSEPLADGEFARFDHTIEGVATYLQSHGVELADVRPGRITLARCPITGADGGTSVAVLVSSEGRIAYCNLHNRGVGLQWLDLREKLEPGYKAYAAARGEPQPDDGGVDFSEFLGGNPPTPCAPAAHAVSDPEFPPHLLEVPGLIGEVMAYNLATAPRPQPVLALAGAIVLQCVLAARKVKDERGNRTNLYCVAVAESGCGKEHARQVNKRILACLDAGQGSRLEAPEDIASDAGLISAVAAQPALLFQLDEFGRFLRASGDPRSMPHLHAALGALMRLYSAAGSNFLGKAYADAKRNTKIEEPCVSLYGTTVPSNFYGSLTPEGMEDGFVARMMAFTGSPTPDQQRVPFGEPPKGVIAGAAWWWKRGIDFGTHSCAEVVQSTPAAVAAIASLGEHAEAERRKASSSAKALWARTEEKACRLALVHACSAHTLGTPVINEASALWACELAEWTTRDMIRVADQHVADGPFDAQLKKLVRKIRSRGGAATRSEISQDMRLKRQDLTALLEVLIEQGKLNVTVGADNGKPPRRYLLA